MTTHEQYEDLVAAYAFETADASERRLLEGHLPGCSICREALEDLRRVSAGIGMTVDPVAPPADLRQRVLDSAARTPVQPQAQGGDSRRVQAPVTSHPPTGRIPLGWRLALAASVVLAAGLGTYAWALRSKIGNLSDLLAQATSQSSRLRAELAAARLDTARLTRTVSVIGAPDVLRVELRGQPGAPRSFGRAYISGSTGVIFSASGLPTPGAGRTYQLWVIPAGAAAKPVDAGIFDVDPTGRATVTAPMPAGVTAAAAVAVSEEPAGGSPTGGPTGAVVLLGRTS